MGAFEKFHHLLNRRHDYALEWKAGTGGKVVGYLCTYVPEEIIYAAGALPVRILGGHEPQDIAEVHIFGTWCPFCRDCLAQGLLGRYHYLEGLVFAESCQHIRQTYESWQRHLPLPYFYELYMPHLVQSPHALGCLVGELREFQRSLEGWLGAPISKEALDRAIEVYNTNRRLMRQIYELRKASPPPVSGVEAMEMVLASMLMDKEEHNRLLEEALKEASQRDGVLELGPRLMILGSENDDTSLLALIESLGAQVVIDEHCTGTRYFWNQVPPGVDRLSALALRYLERPPCPQKDLLPPRRRFSHLLKLAEEYKVQGAVLLLQKFCDAHGYDLPPLQALLAQREIPILLLEVDVTTPVGQFRTRIEAFLEML